MIGMVIGWVIGLLAAFGVTLFVPNIGFFGGTLLGFSFGLIGITVGGAITGREGR